MATLVLVKHSQPEVTHGVPSARWVLSRAGRQRCAWLADELRTLRAERIYSSLEPKALETAALAATSLGLDVRPREGLQENDRSGLGFLPAAEIEARIRRLFDEPDALVMGEEKATLAAERFEAAVRAIAAEAEDGVSAVVTHGTVLTLLVAGHNAVDAFDFWKSLTLPACVVVDADTFRLEGAVRRFAA
jgi:broad specificity phosphatase PhoE